MRLLMYAYEGERQPGVLHGDNVVDLRALAETAGETVPEDLIGLIDRGPEGLAIVQRLLGGELSGHTHPLGEIEILAPLDPPRGNVLAIGRNYAEHARESAQAWNEEVQRPTVFTKAQTSINSPYGEVVIDPRLTKQVDWEVELGVVMGRRGKNIDAAAALDYVFGYTVVNDISARDIQNSWGGQFFKGKSLDGTCPMGPWIVTADEIPDPQNLMLRLTVNGELKQEANTRDMILPVREIVAQLSLGMTLVPGSIIATGTPAGVGMGRKDPETAEPAPEFLHDGDLVEAEVEGIGALRNRIVEREE